MATRDVNNDASSRAVNMAQVEGEFIGKGFMSSTKSAGTKYGNDFAKSTKSLGTKWGEALGEAASIVINRVVKEGTQSINRVAENFLKDYDAISVRLNKNFHEYRQYYNDLNSQLRETGMNIAFSMKDVTTEMMNNMSVGMRGKKLEEKTMSDLIVKKLVPSINTNTRGYTTLYKKLGDSFAQTQVALAKYSESLIGLEAMERGDIQSTMDSLNLDLMYSAKIGGLDTNAVMTGLQSVLYAAGASEYGSDYLAGKFEEIIKGEMTPENASLMMQLGVSNGEELAKMLSSPELTQQLVERIAEYSKSFMGIGGGGKLIAGAISGGSTEDAVRGVVADDFVEKYKTMDMKNFDAEKVYAKAEGDALAGYFNTPSEKLENFEDSVMNDVGTLAATVPHMQDWLGDIGNILLTVGNRIVNAIFMKQIKNSIGKLATNVLGEGAGDAAGSSLLKKGLIKMGRRGATHASESSALASGTLTAVGGTAAIALGGYTAYEGFTGAHESFQKGNTGAGIAKTAGGVAGVAGAGMGAAALLGLASGPVGWIGLAVAGLGLAAVKAAEHMEYMAEDGKTLDGMMKKMAESFKDSTKKLVQETQERWKGAESEEEMRSALVEQGYDQQAVTDLTIDQLKEFRDTLLGMGTHDMGLEIDRMLKEMKDQLPYDSAWNADVLDFMTGGNITTEEQLQAFQAAIDSSNMSDKMKQDWADTFAKKRKDGKGLNEGEAEDLLADLYNNGYDAAVLSRELNVIAPDKWKLTQAEEDYMRFNTETGRSQMETLAQEMETLKKLKAEGASEESINTAKNQIAKDLSYLGITKGSGAAKILIGSDNPEGIPGYRTGLGYVPYDNYPALLHEGEAVLTKGESSKFREVLLESVKKLDMKNFDAEKVYSKAKSDALASYLNTPAVLNDLGLSSTLSVSNAGTEVVDIMSTIATKIDSLGNVLDSILQVIVDIADGQNTTNTVPTNRNLTNYSGGAIE